MRPAELASDQAPSEAALLHAIDQIEREDGRAIDLVVFLQATSPVRSASDIDGAIEQLVKSNADSCFSACAEHFTGRWRLSPEGAARPVNFSPEKRPRRQEYPVEYLENGNIYVFKPCLLRETGSRMGGKIVIYPMGALDSIQIDCLEDLLLAEDVLDVRRRRRQNDLDLSILKNIRLLVLDFDGVMTDNRVIVDQNGNEAVACNRGDGWGLARLRRHGLEIMALSTEANPVVAARCNKLGIPCLQGRADKLPALKAEVQRRSLTAADVAYVGNDVNDLECLEWVGAAIAPSDARPEVLAVARLVTPQRGGDGAVRQVTDWIIAAQKTSS